MTPQEVIKKFMAELNANNYTYDTSNVSTTILDNAVRSSSKFASTQAVITQMLADQVEAEKLAVEEILGTTYAGKTISEVPSNIRSADAKEYDTGNTGNAYLNEWNDNRTTVELLIQERKAEIFLEKYCGIQLEKNYWIKGSTVTYWTSDSGTGNVDTGAITGSDANLTLKAGDVVNGSTLTAANLSTLKSKYGTAASLSSDGNTIVIGTGVEKTETSIVPEEGDMYLFTASGTAKNINTGSNGWVVNATTGNDTITSGGRDSINAGNGNDKIIANADEATITTGAGNDTVEISASVTSVTITDLNSSDTIKISGTFEIGNAQIENSMLVVTDKTGTRKIKFSDLTNAANAKIGAQKISDWLSKADFTITASGDSASGDIATSDTSSGDIASSDVSDDAGRVAIDPNYTPNIEIANFETVDQTQEISSATEINLGEVTIESGTVTSGGATVGTVESVSPAVMNFTTRGLTIHVGDGTATSYNSLSDTQKMMVAALFKWWANNCLELNEDSYNLGFTSDTAKVTDITLSFESLGNSTLALVSSQYRGGDGQVSQLQLKINTSYYNSFTAGDTNGTSTVEGAGFLDRTLAHEFTHAVMATNINNFSYLPQFIKEGMAELTHGIDDERGNKIFALAYNSSSLSSALNLSDTGTGTEICYAGGYMFLRYLAKQAALQTLDNFAPGEITATVNLGTGNATYYVSGNSATETATTSAQNISLGSSSGSTYTVGTTGVNQKINTGDTAKNIVGVNHKSSVRGGAGNDTIQFVEGTLINAGDGNNSIVGSGQFATITAGAGNDSVIVDGSSNSIALGDGNNLASISNSNTYNNTITAGAGNDTVRALSNYYSQINLGDGDNRISLGARNSTIQTGDGADYFKLLYSNDSDNAISLGAGNDTVMYLSTNNTLDMGAGDDYVDQSDGNNVFLFNGESGNDTVWFFNSSDKLVIAGDYATEKTYTYTGSSYVDISVSIKSGESVTGTVLLKQAPNSFTEADNIVIVEAAETPEANPLLITLTSGANSYNNTLDNASILAFAGADSITNTGASVSIDAGDGNDYVYNNGQSVTIDAGAGNDSIRNDADNVSINTGEDDDTITNGGEADLVTIDAGDGNDYVYNNGQSVTIDAGAGNDSIRNDADNVSINAGEDDDTITNGGEADLVTIDAGAGNDSIVNYGASVSINAGAGNDLIYSHGESVTIDVGLGNDSISLASSAENALIQYATGDGLDTVWGFNATSTLQIGDGTDTYSKATVDNDIIVTVGDGEILLKDAASLSAVHISGVEGGGESGTDKLITLTDDDDDYINSVAGATIQALGGDDSITNSYYDSSLRRYLGYASVSINAGDGDDEIYSRGDSATIDGGDGDDEIDNDGDSVLIFGGAGDDSIDNSGTNVTIDGGDGNNEIYNAGSEVSINTGAGDDCVDNYSDATNVTINTGAGNDSVGNAIGSNNVSINTGDGNDTVYNSDSSNVSINTGTGDDLILNYTAGQIYQYASGDGNDTIWGFSSNDTLHITSGTYSTTTSGDDLIVNVGDGKITLKNSANFKITIKNSAGELLTYNSSASNNMLGTNDADGLINNNSDATIQALNGNDRIDNSGDNVSINAGDGNDYIDNSGDSVTIGGGSGNDTIRNSYDGGDNVSISGGDGNDNIYKSDGDNVTINGGKDNDIIGLSQYIKNTLIEYTTGDGYDTIRGFNVDDTLKIGDGTGTYSITESGDDVVVMVGEGSILLVGAASLSAVNIDGVKGESGNPLLIKLTEDDDTYSNSFDDATILAFGGDDSINNAHYDSSVKRYVGSANVSIVAGDGNDSIQNGGDSATINGGDGNDSIWNRGGNNVSINGGDGDDTIDSSEDAFAVTIDAGDGDDSAYAEGDNASINGGAGDDELAVDGKNSTIIAGSGKDNVFNSGLNNVIDLVEGNNTLKNYEAKNATVFGGTDNDSVSNALGGEVGTVYIFKGGNDTLSGIGDADTLVLPESSTWETVLSSSGYNVITVKDAANATLGTITLEDTRGELSITDSTESIIPVNVVYNEENNTLITGVAHKDWVDNSGSTVTVQTGDGNDTINSGGASTKIDGGTGNDEINNTGSNTTLLGNEGDDRLENNNYYGRGGFNVLMDGGDGEDYLFNGGGTGSTLLGGDGDDYIFNRMNWYNGSDSVGYTGAHDVFINGGNGNDAVTNWKSNNVTINGGDGDDTIYNSDSENVLFTYTSGDGNDTITGFNTTSTLQIGGGTGTYSTVQSGNDIIVTVGDGSILLKNVASLDNVNIDGVEDETPEEYEFSWTFSKGTATYVKTSGTSTETVFTISGLNSSLTADDLDSVIEVDENKITLLPEALGQTNVTLTTSGKYTLALDADCPTVTAVDKGWTLDGTTATYHDAGKSEGYKVTNSKTVTYTAPVIGKTLLTVDGIAEGLEVEDGAIDGLEVSGKTLTVTPEVVGDNLSISEGYKVIFAAGNYDGTKFTGTSAKDTIEVNGNGLEIDGGANNDAITSNSDGGNIYLFASANGKDTITGYGDNDTIKITDGSAVSVSVKGNNIIVTAGKGSMTLKNSAKNGAHVLIVDSTDETLIDGTYYSDKIVDGNSVTLTSAFKEKIYTTEEPIEAVDGSAVSGKFSLIGGDEDNTLIGGKGANFINGGGGENILTGGKGNDTFATGNGNDTITDYGVGTDKISLGADITDFSIKDGDIVLNFDDEKSLTIQNGDGKKINFVQNGKASTELFTANGRTNTQGTSITLTSSTEDYTATAKMLTIDGGLTDDVWIVGNTKANKILGGAGDDTLNGGSGKDTLTGGAGEDIFIYESGKDVITDYVSGEDKISLSAATTSETLDKKGNVVLKFGSSNSLTIKAGDSSDGREITFTGDNGDTTKTYYSERIVGADGVTLQSTFQGNTFTATNDLPNVDASAVTKKFTLTGGDEDNTLIGGKGANLIDGGAGSDLLIGNGGNDTFVYSSGDDTIGDYDTKDRISLSSAMTNFSLENDDVIIGFASGSLTIQDSAGKSITFVETTGTKVTNSVNVFAADGIFNNTTTTKATAVTLAADTSSFDAKSYSKLVTIDGGLVTGDASIVGNTKNNKIYAGATINGGKGNDSLWGGGGSDTFIYESGGGKDVVYNFANDDALQLGGTFAATVKDNSIAFKVGSTANALTLKDYTATEFNINGDAYQISGNTLAKK